MNLNEIEEFLKEENLSLDMQKEKCKICPCMDSGKFRGCINCKNWTTDCEEFYNKALCNSDVCVLTRLGLEMEATNESK